MMGNREIWVALRQWRETRDDQAWQHLEHLRSVQQAGHARRARFYNWMLAWLGQRLSTWGDRLQEHYGNSCAMQLGTPSISGDSIREG